MTKREQQEKLFRAIGFVGDDLIQRADAPVEKQKANVIWLKWAALAACCALVIGLASKLPLWGMKSENAAETATMTMDTASASAQESPAEAPEATEETTEEAADEAPAEEELKTGESGSAARGEAAADGAETYSAALAQQLLDTTLGPVKLGMPSGDVRSLLGAPKEESDELYVCTDKGDYRYIYWKYNLTNDPDYLCDVSLQFADRGDGLVLNDIQTFGTSDWSLPTGIQNGSSAEDAIAAYPDAQAQYNGPDGALSAVVFEAGHVHLHILIENDVVTSISLGTYYEDPSWEAESAASASAYSFASASITIYQKAASGWRSHTLTGKDAKRIEVICGIEDLVPIDALPAPAYYLDFQNGTVVMLGEDRISGAVYTCEDFDAFRAAMEEGADPTPYLELLEQAEFPYGTDDVIKEMAIEE